MAMQMHTFGTMKRPITHCSFLAATLFLGSPTLFSQDATTTHARDNTKVNKRDRATPERTADQAKETTSDREIMRKIRRAVVADKSLSTYAHNVKIISEHSKVTLKGPVHSAEESKSIEAKQLRWLGLGT